jgi:hypothetical protein
MNQHSPAIEWQIVENDADWACLCASPVDVPLPVGVGATSNRLAATRRLVRVVTVFLLLASANGWGGRMTQVASPQQRAGRDTTVYPALTLVHSTGNRPHTSDGGPLGSLDRWYQHSGEERTLETPYFVYRFRQVDAPVVIAVAPQVDALYITLRQNFGLPIRPDAEKLLIQLSPTPSIDTRTPWLRVADQFTVPAPEVYPAQVGLTDVELLAQSIALPLSGHVLAQAKEQYQVDLAWQQMMNALYLWQIWDLDLPLATWRDDVVRWVYLTLPASAAGQSVTLPSRYSELCAVHRLWAQTPAQLGIPLICTELDGQAWFFSSSMNLHNSLMRLGQFAVALQPDPYDFVQLVHRPDRTVALATLIDYAVVTYGRERLPALMAGLGQSTTWETLLPPVFGVSPAEFETGWQAFLAERYGVPLSTILP